MREPLRGPREIPLRRHADDRGVLHVLDAPELDGFTACRMFFVTEVPADATRGQHAHLECSQVFVAATGSLTVDTWHEGEHRRFSLRVGGPALHVPPLTFAVESDFAPGTTLVVLADRGYDTGDTLESDEFFGTGRATKSEIRIHQSNDPAV